MTGLLVGWTTLLITLALVGGSVLILADGGYPVAGVVVLLSAGVLGYALIRLLASAPRKRRRYELDADQAVQVRVRTPRAVASKGQVTGERSAAPPQTT